MDKKNIIPQAAKPVVRVTQGTSSAQIAELSEEVLQSNFSCTLSGSGRYSFDRCSYDD
ncbi:MAG: DUF5837 family cyanobactin class RiPP [Rivularia sp. (in: cyanobacteria)]